MAPVVPPIKCQGIKTKIVRAIRSLQPMDSGSRWLEPFCGSCVVPFNLRPEEALLCDSNEHIIRFYTENLRNSMTEALISNFASVVDGVKKKKVTQPGLFDSLDDGVIDVGEVANQADGSS